MKVKDLKKELEVYDDELDVTVEMLANNGTAYLGNLVAVYDEVLGEIIVRGVQS